MIYICKNFYVLSASTSNKYALKKPRTAHVTEVKTFVITRGAA